MFRILDTNLLVHELFHLFVALLVAGYLYQRFKSLTLAGLGVLVSFLIDADHIFEGFLIHGGQVFLIFPFIKTSFFREVNKTIVFFHSWELIPLFWWWGKRFKKQALATMLIASLVGHLLVDQLSYSVAFGMSWGGYSFIYRWLNGFSLESFKGTA